MEHHIQYLESRLAGEPLPVDTFMAFCGTGEVALPEETDTRNMMIEEIE